MSSELTEAAIALWHLNGGPAPELVAAEACAVSGNNRVLLLRAPGFENVVAKFYFQEASGSNGRLTAEWQFLRFAAEVGITNTPKPIACNMQQLVAIYQFVDGRKLNPAEIRDREVLIAADFIRRLNAHKLSEHAVKLPTAAEAGFSVSEHFAIIDRRIARLSEIRPELTIDFEAIEFASALAAYWRTTKNRVAQAVERIGLDLAVPLSKGERVISPSDFGFHNALLQPDASIIFIDFEYAGWDDIAKLAADFFFQPAVPVQSEYFELFLHRLTDEIPEAERVRQRCRLLRPIFGIKWCCIMLNRFLPDMIARSQFADPDHNESDRKKLQLAKAQHAFANLEKARWLT